MPISFMAMNISSVYVIPVDGGTVAYEIAGAGPLVVCVPGMGDLRSTWRHLAPSLIAAGYRVALTDLRGHGDSSTDFAEYDDEATARDIIALVEHLGEPAVVIGNSMGAGSAVIAAATRPELVRGLVLVGPFVRNPPSVGVAMRLAFRVLMARPWAAAVWKGYLPSLYKGRLPEDQAEYLDTVAAALKRPGYGAAFSRTTRTTHAPAEAALPAVSAPALIIMGELDPDFPDPAAEAAWIGEQLSATVVMAPEAGHYPQSQRPDVVVPAVASFLAGLGTNA
jgi:pimeloyl-ACP methyl ester carboxylesterase